MYRFLLEHFVDFSSLTVGGGAGLTNSSFSYQIFGLRWGERMIFLFSRGEFNSPLMPTFDIEAVHVLSVIIEAGLYHSK